MQCIDGLSILLQRYVRKGNDAKDPAIFRFCFPKEPSLIQRMRSCRFLTIQSLEFQEIWPKNSSQTTQMIYHEKL